jgi:phenylacetate-CoA ligase
MLKTLFKIYPPALSTFLSRIPASALEQRGVRFALKTANEVFNRVPAYRQFLARRQVNTGPVKTMEDFKNLPIMDKKNYLMGHSTEDLCLDGTLTGKYLIDSSSGYGGKQSFWPRLAAEDADYPMYMELSYRQFYQIDRRPTLMIITLILGTWIGGEKISWATRNIAINKKNNLTVMTPGMNLDETIGIVERFGNLYDQVVLVGYPPFVKRIIDEGAARGIDWKKINLKLGLGGESYSEEWRDYTGKKIGLQENDLLGIAGGYGAADLGMSVGREYPLSVLIRKLAYNDEALARDLFGQWKPLPSFCQYNPSTFFIEEIDGELIFTAMAGIPVLRYNIHDRGGILPFEKALEILSHHGYKPLEKLAAYGCQGKDIWRLPFFYVWGRSDGAVSLYGLCIYTENVKTALDHPSISDRLTGNFFMEVTYDGKQNPHLQLKIELRPGIEPDPGLEKKFTASIAQSLESQSADYKALRKMVGEEALPQVIPLHHQAPGVFDPGRIKNRYTA